MSLTFHRGTYRIHVQGSSYNPLARRALWPATKTGGSTNTGNRQGRQWGQAHQSQGQTCIFLNKAGSPTDSSVICDVCSTNKDLQYGDGSSTWCCYPCSTKYHKFCADPATVDAGVLGWLLVVVLFAPIRGGSLGICFVCWMLLRHCTEALVHSTHPREAAASSYLAIIFGRIASGVARFLRSTAEPMQHPHQCWCWCRLW